MDRPGKKILTFEMLTLGYGRERILLEKVSAEAREGEMIALVGKNGSGKSTLLRTLAGLQSYPVGKIALQQKEISDYQAAALAQHMTFVGTGNQFMQNLTVYELVSLGRHPHTNWWGKLKALDHERISESIRFVGMEAFAGARLEQLSDGERQRAVIAMALSRETPLIILDEPTAFLDIPNKIAIMEVLYQMKNTGRTVIFSTHDFDNVFSYADKLWIIKEKSLLQGAPEDLGLDDKLTDLFSDPEIVFQKDHLGFHKPRKGRQKVYLHPVKDKNVLFWTRRALERIGYEITGQAGKGIPEVKILREEENTYWEFRSGSNIQTFQSLYEMNDCLTAVR